MLYKNYPKLLSFYICVCVWSEFFQSSLFHYQEHKCQGVTGVIKKFSNENVRHVVVTSYVNESKSGAMFNL